MDRRVHRPRPHPGKRPPYDFRPAPAGPDSSSSSAKPYVARRVPTTPPPRGHVAPIPPRIFSVANRDKGPVVDRTSFRHPHRRTSYNDDSHIQTYRPYELTLSGRKRRGVRDPLGDRRSFIDHIQGDMTENYPLRRTVGSLVKRRTPIYVHDVCHRATWSHSGAICPIQMGCVHSFGNSPIGWEVPDGGDETSTVPLPPPPSGIGRVALARPVVLRIPDQWPSFATLPLPGGWKGGESHSSGVSLCEFAR